MMLQTTSSSRSHFAATLHFIGASAVAVALTVSGCGQNAGIVAPATAAGAGGATSTNADASMPASVTRNIASVQAPNARVRAAGANVNGGNGVYAYGTRSVFPSSTYHTSNYWVDVVFTAAAGSTGSGVFSTNSTPGTITENDPNAVELGFAFQSSVAGTITGIRFYKGSKNTGTHVGSLWTAGGSRLATATFTSETSSGWQQVNFAAPVSIAASTNYVASYHTNAGYYSADDFYYTACRRNGTLTALGPSPCVVLGPTPTPSPSSAPSGTPSPVPSGTPTPRPTPVPSPTPTPVVSGDLQSVLCVGGSKYTLDDHDWFDKDSSLRVSDTWPESGGAEWSNQFSWARYNNVGTDLSYYPSQAQLAPGGFTTGGLPPVAALKLGAGVELSSYPVPTPTTAAEDNTMSAQAYLSGLLSNSKAYTNGYWVFSAQLPGGNGWWPALWLLSESGGNYLELDNMEQWGPNTLGSNVVAQTEQGSPKLSQWTTVGTGDSAQHSYGAIATPNYVGFYVDGQTTTKQYPRYQQSALNPIMNMQVCSSSSWCGPAPAKGVTAQMLVKYYAHYSPPVAPAPCSPSDIATPAP